MQAQSEHEHERGPYSVGSLPHGMKEKAPRKKVPWMQTGFNLEAWDSDSTIAGTRTGMTTSTHTATTMLSSTKIVISLDEVVDMANSVDLL